MELVLESNVYPTLFTSEQNLSQYHKLTGTKPVHNPNNFWSRRIIWATAATLLCECWALCRSCRRVLIRSSGWKIIVEHVPDNEPARNDVTAADFFHEQITVKHTQ